MFNKATRTMMAMLFDRSTVDEIDGKMEDGRAWHVNIRRPNLFQDYTYFDGYVSGAYNDDFRGGTLEETLDKMEAWFSADKAIKAELKGESHVLGWQDK